jgi:trigger factor
MGSNRASASTQGDFVALMVDGFPLIGFRFEDGHYLLNICLFDEANQLVLRIADNELTYATHPWDLEMVGRRLIIRSALAQVFIDIRFEPPNLVYFDRGRLLFNGVEIIIRPEFFFLVNTSSLFQGNSCVGSVVAFNIGSDPRNLSCAFRFPGIPRYGVDRAAILRSARNKLSAENAGGLG